MRYEFNCVQCPGPGSDGHKTVAFDLEISMTKAPAIGAKRKCPCCQRRTAIRVVSTGVGAIVKGQVRYDWKPGESMRTCINGQETRFTFIDHPEGDPAYRRNLANMARKQGVRETAGLRNARLDEKSGRMVVDVMSDKPDPLGAIQRAKKKGDWDPGVKRQINTPVKYRRAVKRR